MLRRERRLCKCWRRIAIRRHAVDVADGNRYTPRVHPVLFTAFGEPVFSYVVATVLGYGAGVAFGIAMGLKDGRSLRDLFDLALVCVISALLGSKLFHTLFEAKGHVLSDGTVADGIVDLLKDDPWHWARLFEAGYVFYGGVVGGIAMLYLFMVRRRMPDKGSIGDYATPGLLFGIVVGRIGCFLAGCCYGSATSMPWGVVFPDGHPSDGACVHPVQLYDAAYGVIALCAFALLYRRRRFGGEAFCAFVVSYAAFRFGTEMFRADADRGLWFGGVLSTSQLVALTTVPITLFFWRRALRLVRAGRLRKPGEPLPVEERA